MSYDYYFAGLFDGEGMVALHPRNIKKFPGVFSLLISITNCDRRPLDKAQALYGGNVIVGKPKQNPKHRQVFIWRACSGSAVPFLEVIRPYLLIKGEQVDVALSWFQQKRKHSNKGTSQKLTAKEIETNLVYYRRLQQMKRPHMIETI